jgi:MFS family permease
MLRELRARGLTRIMLTDFMFWSAVVGSAPLISRLVEQEMPDSANQLISHFILYFTVGSLLGRFFAARMKVDPRLLVYISVGIATLATGFFLVVSEDLWKAGQVLQGLAMGMYGVSIFAINSSLIPADKRMTWFSIVAIADFLGFACGPVISGVIVQVFSIQTAVIVFLVMLGIGFINCFRFPQMGTSDDEESTGSAGKITSKQLMKAAIGLHLALFLSLLYHVFYGRYMPITFETRFLAIESLFFGGYIFGGLAYRFGGVQVMQRMTDRGKFLLSLTFMTLTALGVALFPIMGQGLEVFCVFVGMLYGMGFEALYIFSMAWVASNANKHERPKLISLIFMGFDLSSLAAGVSFGPLMVYTGTMGLFYALLLLLPLYLMLPWLLPTQPLKKRHFTVNA